MGGGRITIINTYLEATKISHENLKDTSRIMVKG